MDHRWALRVAGLPLVLLMVVGGAVAPAALAVTASSAGTGEDGADLGPKVHAAVAAFDTQIAKLVTPAGHAEGTSVDAVKGELDRMVTLDQYVRRYAATPDEKQFTVAERRQFGTWYADAARATLGRNVQDLKALLKRINWVDRRQYGAKADFDARLLVQYADFDLPFQREVLATLKGLYPQGGTSPESYAYLADAVAAGEHQPQQYGTQGRCAGPGVWKPLPIADEEQVGRRRSELGLAPMNEYVARYAAVCK